MKKLFVAVAVLALSLMVVAGAKKSVTINLFDNTTVGGVQLKPGEYRVHINDTTATFELSGKEVAKIAIHPTQANEKFNVTEVLTSSDHALARINIGGTTESLVVDGPAK